MDNVSTQLLAPSRAKQLVASFLFLVLSIGIALLWVKVEPHVFFMALFAGACFGLCFFWEKTPFNAVYFLLVMAFLLPSYYLTLILVDVIGLCGVIIVFFFFGYLRKPKWVESLSAIEKTILVYFTIATVATLAHPSILSIGIWIQALFPSLAVFGITRYQFSKRLPDDFLPLFRLIATLCGIVGAVCLYQFFFGDLPFFGDFFYERGRFHFGWYASPKFARTYGFQGHPVPNGFLLAVAFPITILAFSTAKDKIQRFGLFIVLAFHVIGLVLSFSRGAWLSTLLAFSFLALRRPKYLVLTSVFLLSAFLIITTLLSLYPELQARLTTFSLEFILNDPSFLHRLAMYDSVYRILQDYPIFGASHIDIAVLYKQYKNPLDPMNVAVIDNSYLFASAMFGVLAGAAYLSIFVLLLVKLFTLQRQKEQPLIRDIATYLSMSIFILFVNSFNFDVQTWTTTAVLIWLVIGCVISLLHQAEFFSAKKRLAETQ
jgi:O-antigen ligase